MAASTRNFYTYNISTEEAALVAEDTRCCDRSHGHAAARARAICARPKILIVYKDGRYAIVHAGQQVPLFGHGWLIQEPCDTSLVFARGCVEADEVTAMLTGAKEGLQEEHKNRKLYTPADLRRIGRALGEGTTLTLGIEAPEMMKKYLKTGPVDTYDAPTNNTTTSVDISTATLTSTMPCTSTNRTKKDAHIGAVSAQQSKPAYTYEMMHEPEDESNEARQTNPKVTESQVETISESTSCKSQDIAERDDFGDWERIDKGAEANAEQNGRAITKPSLASRFAGWFRRA